MVRLFSKSSKESLSRQPPDDSTPKSPGAPLFLVTRPQEEMPFQRKMSVPVTFCYNPQLFVGELILVLSSTWRPCLSEAWVHSVSIPPPNARLTTESPPVAIPTGVERGLTEGLGYTGRVAGDWHSVPLFLPLRCNTTFTLKPWGICIQGADLDVRIFDRDKWDVTSFQVFILKAVKDSQKTKLL